MPFKLNTQEITCSYHNVCYWCKNATGSNYSVFLYIFYFTGQSVNGCWLSKVTQLCHSSVALFLHLQSNNFWMLHLINSRASENFLSIICRMIIWWNLENAKGKMGWTEFVTRLTTVCRWTNQYMTNISIFQLNILSSAHFPNTV